MFAIRSRSSFAGYCRAAEERGYDVIFTTDHLGSPAPFPSLVAALLIQAVVVTGDRPAVARKLVAEHFPDLAPQRLLDAPCVLIGTAKQIAERLREARERYGFSFITVHEPYMETFAPVIEELRAGKPAGSSGA